VDIMTSGAVDAGDADGRHDFDFLMGRWRIWNRRLDDPVSEHPTNWQEFEATVDAEPILGGLGNFDRYFVPDFPGRGMYHGFGLRLFDPESRLWRIWWASTVGRGELDLPVVGRFDRGVGRFECDDLIGGRKVRVRFIWNEVTPASARWVQSFSFDDGHTFYENWIMMWARR
jgi:hypothetical protein